MHDNLFGEKDPEQLYVTFLHCIVNKLKLTFVPHATLSHFTRVRGGDCETKRLCDFGN